MVFRSFKSFGLFRLVWDRVWILHVQPRTKHEFLEARLRICIKFYQMLVRNRISGGASLRAGSFILGRKRENKEGKRRGASFFPALFSLPPKMSRLAGYGGASGTHPPNVIESTSTPPFPLPVSNSTNCWSGTG